MGTKTTLRTAAQRWDRGLHTWNPGCIDSIPSRTLAVIYFLAFAGGLAANTLALWVFACHTRSSAVQVYLFHLAVSDTLLSLAMPVRATEFSAPPDIHPPPLSRDACRVFDAFCYTNMYNSILLLACVAITRYLRLVHPNSCPLVTQPRAAHAIAISVWICVILMEIPFYTMRVSQQTSNQIRCYYYKKGKTIWAVAINMIAVAAFFVVLAVMVFCYMGIRMQLERHMNMVTSTVAQAVCRRNAFGHDASRKGLVVLCIFCVCFVPYHIVRPFFLLSQAGLLPAEFAPGLHVTNEIVLCLVTLNACLDPVIYFFINRGFRKSVKGIGIKWRRIFHLHKSNTPTSTVMTTVRQSYSGDDTKRWCCLSNLLGYRAQSWTGHHSDTGYQQAGTHFANLGRMTGTVNPTWY
uniref:G-protein coupled receptors family 1 profile domain-containing protein n=1 Tax=Eptatretus burgeri TaxID=7764 RepID=A0A8C4Q6Y2_EPTBU